MERPASYQREVGKAQFGNNTTIHQDNNTYTLHLPLRPAPAAIRIIPYPLNEDIVNRPDLVNKLNALLPQTSNTYRSAALWGLGGSGKTQIALNFAYQRYNRTSCPVFWVHADNEATFSQDYKKIAREFHIDESLKGEELLAAVCDRIAALPDWVLILDNADDLRLFGVGQAPGQTKNLFQYIPRSPMGTVLWTSRDAHIAGTLVGTRRGIKVSRMNYNEAEELLTIARDLETNEEESETAALLEELQWLPLAVTQAGAYMRRTSTSAKEYLSLLAQSKRRWDILKENEFDRHRRPDMSNNVLETWSISIDRLRQESEIAYNILHVIAYVANQNIPHEIITTALKRSDNNLVQPEKIEAEATRAITRLKEFSFIGIHQMEDGSRSYEMHKLVQEATRYGLSVWKPRVLHKGASKKEAEQYFSSVALRVILDLFPSSKPETWTQCEKYLAHALQIGDWADLNEKQPETARLLLRVSGFLHGRGRWRERELVNKRTLELSRKVLGEKHPDTLRSMSHLATTYWALGRYSEAEALDVQVLDLRREILGDRHPETIKSMASLAATYHEQGRYNEAEAIEVQVLELRREIRGDKHPDTIKSMSELASTYHGQGRFSEAEAIDVQVLDLRREILGDKDPSTIQSMGSLASTYHEQGRFSEAEALKVQVLDLRREILGDKHPGTIQSMGSLASTYHKQGRFSEAEALDIQALHLQQEILGKEHPGTLLAMHNLAWTWNRQGRHSDALGLMQECVQYRRSLLGPKHPHTVKSVKYLEKWKSKYDTLGSNRQLVIRSLSEQEEESSSPGCER